jgi:hypothetical protein
MTADPRLTHSAFVDVITHVSEIVCLEPGWTQPDPSAGNVPSPVEIQRRLTDPVSHLIAVSATRL